MIHPGVPSLGPDMNAGRIDLHRLSVSFASGGLPPAPVLRDVSLSVPARSVVGLVGESGSGKSTVALALLGLLAPNATVGSGQLDLGGRHFDMADAAALATLRGRDVAMVFQDPAAALNPAFTIGAHLAEVQRLRAPDLGRAARRAQATEALAAVGIDRPAERLRAWPHELSGGMRQRVVIAMALLARPRLLIADEPTTALDVTVEAQVMDSLGHLRDEIGCSILLITHSLGLVARYCDEVALLYAGEVVEQGPVGAVVGGPAHPYTAALFACDVAIDGPRSDPALAHRFMVIPGELPDPRNRPPGCIYAPRCTNVRADCVQSQPAPAETGGTATKGAAAHLVRCLHPL